MNASMHVHGRPRIDSFYTVGDVAKAATPRTMKMGYDGAMLARDARV